MFKRWEQKNPETRNKTAIIKALEGNKLSFALRLIENTSNSEEILGSLDAQPGIEKILGNNLRTFNIENLITIIEKIKPSDDILESPQIKAYAVDGIHNALRNINPNNWEKNIEWFFDTFNIKQEDLKSLEIQALVEKRFSDYIRIGKHEKALFLRNKFTPNDPIWKERIKESLCLILKAGDNQSFKEMLRIFSQDIDEQISDNKEVIEHAKLGIRNNRNTAAAKALFDFFSLDDVSIKDIPPGGISIRQTRNLSTKLSRRELMLLEKMRKNYPTEA